MNLFWKIFASFWLTVVLMVVSSLWVVDLLRHEEDVALHGKLSQQFDRLQENLQQGGSLALVLHADERIDAPEELLVTTEDNQLLWPRDASDYALRLLPSLSPANPTLKEIHRNMLTIGTLVHTDDGETLKIVARQPLPPPQKQGLLIAIALLISVIVCGVMTRALVMPLRRLRVAAGQLAEGDLDARVDQPTSILGRDELDQLSDDFNYMADKLRQSLAAHKQLLHDVSHELRSPLTRIRLAVELARGKNNPINAMPDVAIDNSLRRIDQECEQLNQLIGELLSLPQLDAQTVQLDEQVALAELLYDRVEAARMEADASSKKLQLNVTVNPSMLVKGRADLLSRMIDNLLSNALRYSPINTVVDVSLSSTEHELQLSIQDQGNGVPEADLDRIFEPFVRVETARERRGRRTGRKPGPP